MMYKKESKIGSMLNPRGKFLAYGRPVQLILHKKDMWLFEQFKKNISKTNVTINYNGISEEYGAYHLFKCYALIFDKWHPIANKINMDTIKFIDNLLMTMNKNPYDPQPLINKVKEENINFTREIIRNMLKPSSIH